MYKAPAPRPLPDLRLDIQQTPLPDSQIPPRTRNTLLPTEFKPRPRPRRDCISMAPKIKSPTSSRWNKRQLPPQTLNQCPAFPPTTQHPTLSPSPCFSNHVHPTNARPPAPTPHNPPPNATTLRRGSRRDSRDLPVLNCPPHLRRLRDQCSILRVVCPVSASVANTGYRVFPYSGSRCGDQRKRDL